MLIVIEGIDGSGKTTQTNLLLKEFRKAHISAGTIKFPQYNLFFGRVLKKFLQGNYGSLNAIHPYFVSCLYALDRFQSKEKLRRLLQCKDVVVLQRYTTSSMLYQTAKMPPHERTRMSQWIENMEYSILGLPRPDLVIYLCLPTHLAYALITKRGKVKGLYEKKISLLRKANALGIAYARTKKNWELVPSVKDNTMLPPSEIGEQILKIVKRRLETIR